MISYNDINRYIYIYVYIIYNIICILLHPLLCNMYIYIYTLYSPFALIFSAPIAQRPAASQVTEVASENRLDDKETLGAAGWGTGS